MTICSPIYHWRQIVLARDIYIFNVSFVSWVRVMVFNPTFNIILVISWQSVLLVEETGVPRENHKTAASQ
jgi:hypothetical protein